MEIHVGKQIKKRLLETGMSKSEFARRINKTSQNVYDIFDRKTIDTGLLVTISEVLEFDFFELYVYEIKKDAKLKTATSGELKQHLSAKHIVTAILQMEEKMNNQDFEITELKKEIAYLMEINGLLSGRNKIK